MASTTHQHYNRDNQYLFIMGSNTTQLTRPGNTLGVPVQHYNRDNQHLFIMGSNTTQLTRPGNTLGVPVKCPNKVACRPTVLEVYDALNVAGLRLENYDIYLILAFQRFYVLTHCYIQGLKAKQFKVLSA